MRHYAGFSGITAVKRLCRAFPRYRSPPLAAVPACLGACQVPPNVAGEDLAISSAYLRSHRQPGPVRILTLLSSLYMLICYYVFNYFVSYVILSEKLLMSEILYFLIKFRIPPAYRTGVHSTRERFSEQFGICVRFGILCHLLTL